LNFLKSALEGQKNWLSRNTTKKMTKNAKRWVTKGDERFYTLKGKCKFWPNGGTGRSRSVVLAQWPTKVSKEARGGSSKLEGAISGAKLEKDQKKSGQAREKR